MSKYVRLIELKVFEESLWIIKLEPPLNETGVGHTIAMMMFWMMD